MKELTKKPKKKKYLKVFLLSDKEWLQAVKLAHKKIVCIC